jgi:hypothetical protein
MKKDNEEIKTPGFFVNLDWNKTIQKISNEEAGQLLKNMCNYALDQPLIETTDNVENICDLVVFKTIDINKNKYVEKCKVNAENGQLGGRPKGAKNKNPEKPNGLIENPEKPNGLIENPEKPKDKSKDKNKDKDISNIILDSKSRDIENDKNRTRLEIVKMKKLVDIDLKTIISEEEIDFSINVKELVRILNWTRFELLIFYTSEKDVEGLLTEYDKLGCLQGILEIKEHYSYFLDAIIK